MFGKTTGTGQYPEAHVAPPKSDCAKAVKDWTQTVVTRAGFQKLSSTMGLDKGNKWLKDYQSALVDVAKTVLGRRLTSEAAYKSIASAPLGLDLNLGQGFEQEAAAAAALAKAAEEKREADVLLQSGWAAKDSSYTTSTPKTPKISGSFSEQGRSFLDTSHSPEPTLGDPEAIAKKRLELRREGHQLALHTIVETGDFMEATLRRKLHIYLQDADNHLGNNKDCPIYSEKGLHFGMVATFLEGELEDTPTLIPMADRIAALIRGPRQALPEFVKQVSIVRGIVSETTTLDLTQIPGKKDSDALY